MELPRLWYREVMQPLLFQMDGSASPILSWCLVVLALGFLGFSGLRFRRDGLRAGATSLVLALVLGAVAWVVRGASFEGVRYVLTSSGAAWIIAAWVGWVLSVGLAGPGGVGKNAAGGAFFLGAAVGLVVARFMYLWVNPGAAYGFSSWISMAGGGLLGYPGVLVGLLAAAIWLGRRHSRRQVWAWLDGAAIALSLSSAVGRAGCYLYGCDFGRELPSGSPAWLTRFGVFPQWNHIEISGAGAGAFVHQLNKGLITPEHTHSLAVHPTQLYELVAYLGLFGCLVFARYRRLRAGETFLLFLLGYAIIRFSIDLFRADLDRGLVGPALEGRLMLALGWLSFACLVVLAARFNGAPRRVVFWLSALVLLPGGLMLISRISSPAWDTLALSLTQWLALLSAGFACAAYHRLSRAPTQAAA